MTEQEGSPTPATFGRGYDGIVDSTAGRVVCEGSR